MSRDAIALLWLGSEALLAGPDGRPGPTLPVPAEDPAGALARRLAGEFPQAAAVRILYQPAALALEMVAPAEAAGRRAAGRRRGCVWSAEQGPPGSEEALLASEARSPLPALVRALEDQGLRVEGAWTLAALLGAMPRGPAEGPACLRLAVIGSWALLASADAQGRKRLRLHRAEAAAELAADLSATLATFDEQRQPPAWAVLEDEAWPPEIREAVRRLVPAEVPLAALLAQARRLPRGGSEDFLRPAPDRRRRLLAMGAVALLALAAVFAAWRAHVAAADQRRQSRIREAAGAAARDSELAAARQLEAINRAVAEALPPRYRLDLLLLALSRATPPGVCLREVSSQGPDFLVRGRIGGPEEPAGDPLRRMREALAAGDAAWSWRETPAPAGRDFLWRGCFRAAEEPPAARTAGEGAARLAQARGQLPERGPAEGALALLMRGWTEAPGDAPGAAGWRVRRFSLDRPPLAAWSGIVATVRALAAEPGLTLEAIELEAGDEGAGAFAQARLDVELRWRGAGGG
ncbi:MAG TPA: hypothetical protein VHC86_13480 [Opitutaceae bacterium]|nr:hypothetical protein [Opitutaceae bacterium]